MNCGEEKKVTFILVHWSELKYHELGENSFWCANQAECSYCDVTDGERMRIALEPNNGYEIAFSTSYLPCLEEV